MFATRASSTACTMKSDSCALRPRGFSHITILPAFAAATAISRCVSFGLAMSIRSISGDSTIFRQCVSTFSYPQFSAHDLRAEQRAREIVRGELGVWEGGGPL